jgi:hypothetical protein
MHANNDQRGVYSPPQKAMYLGIGTPDCTQQLAVLYSW